MKKVKLLNQYCGPRGSFPPGSVIDVPDEEGKQLVEGGYATSVQAEKRETAAAQKPATAVKAPAKAQNPRKK